MRRQLPAAAPLTPAPRLGCEQHVIAPRGQHEAVDYRGSGRAQLLGHGQRGRGIRHLASLGRRRLDPRITLAKQLDERQRDVARQERAVLVQAVQEAGQRAVEDSLFVQRRVELVQGLPPDVLIAGTGNTVLELLESGTNLKTAS